VDKLYCKYWFLVLVCGVLLESFLKEILSTYPQACVIHFMFIK